MTLIKVGDREFVMEFDEFSRPDDVAMVIGQLSLWLDINLDVRLEGRRLTVKHPNRLK